MYSAIAGAAMLSLAFSLVPARVQAPMGRAPKPQTGLTTPKMWQDRTGQFALERPAAERWMLRGGVRGPDGEPVPLLAMSQETGAQLVVQTADGIHDIRLLARGGEAYGFSFTVADEVRGRVAVVRAGDHVALAVASWPMGAPPEVVDDVDAMIGSLGPVPGALAPGVF